jgi:hypothetical protein
VIGGMEIEFAVLPECTMKPIRTASSSMISAGDVLIEDVLTIEQEM